MGTALPGKVNQSLDYKVNQIFFPWKSKPNYFGHRPGHSLGKNLKLHEMKNEKNYIFIFIHKIWQIFKSFSRALS